MLPAGVFDVNLPLASKEFKNINIEKPKGFFSGLTGNVARNVEPPSRKFALFFLLFVMVGCTVFLIYGRMKKRGNSDYGGLAKMRKDNFSDTPKTEKSNSFEYGKASEADIADFRQRMTEKFQKEEKNKTWNDFVAGQKRNIEQDKPKGGGLFNMFN